ncbi:hypothetical protein PIB30_076285 [Stylosanthes scabra]|uniref:Uncharacterized protein n=1 Tax=Stylosanthes scabra TaxID=79078 RepID=A0ABU6VRD5_9FABA|nr:hypothetical protein [Stylosanthes scabra]
MGYHTEKAWNVLMGMDPMVHEAQVVKRLAKVKMNGPMISKRVMNGEGAFDSSCPCPFPHQTPRLRLCGFRVRAAAVPGSNSSRLVLSSTFHHFFFPSPLPTPQGSEDGSL